MSAPGIAVWMDTRDLAMKMLWKALWAMLLTAIFVALEGAVLWAAELPPSYRRCPGVQGREYAEMNVPADDATTIPEFTRMNDLKCQRVTWMLRFEDTYGHSIHFECDGRWTYRWPADHTGLRPISRAAICYTGL